MFPRSDGTTNPNTAWLQVASPREAAKNTSLEPAMTCAKLPAPMSQLMRMITPSLCLSPPGSIQTRSAISQPATTARATVVHQSWRTASLAMSLIARFVSGSTMARWSIASAKSSVPTRFATSTTAQSRSTLRSVSRDFSDSSGTTGVSVFSVNSC